MANRFDLDWDRADAEYEQTADERSRQRFERDEDRDERAIYGGGDR